MPSSRNARIEERKYIVYSRYFYLLTSKLLHDISRSLGIDLCTPFTVPIGTNYNVCVIYILHLVCVRVRVEDTRETFRTICTCIFFCVYGLYIISKFHTPFLHFVRTLKRIKRKCVLTLYIYIFTVYNIII